MDKKHRIRLRGPWSFMANRGRPDESILPVRFPITWSDLPRSPSATADLSRVFQSPTGLSAGHRIYLVLDHGGVVGGCWLNGRPLPMPQPLPVRESLPVPGSQQCSAAPSGGLGKWDITCHIQRTNLVLLSLDVPEGVPPGEAVPIETWLEIEEPDDEIREVR